MTDKQDDELLKVVRKHLIDVDQHGYVEGEDDVVATAELATLIRSRERTGRHNRKPLPDLTNHWPPSMRVGWPFTKSSWITLWRYLNRSLK